MHRLTSFCTRHPCATVVVTLPLAALAARSALRTELSVGLDATLGDDYPALREFDAFLERFGGGYPVLVAYECARADVCRSALDPPALEMAHAVSQQLLQTSYVSRVSS